MKTVADIFDASSMTISFEIFPPKGELTYEQACEVAQGLAPLDPSYISVTCSAGGVGSSESTSSVAEMIQRDLDIPAIAHVTCINKTEESLDETIQDLKDRSIRSVLALRGDLPPGTATTEDLPFPYASSIIPRLTDAGFCVGAAAYPEGHIACLDPRMDIERLKEKQDLGASFLVTQLFFTNDLFYRFKEQTEKAGITVPITCGIMPFLSKSQISRMVFMCGASLPSPIIKLLARYEDDPDSLKAAGLEYACDQLVDLAEHGVDGLHIYTMNQRSIAEAAMTALSQAGFTGLS